MISNAFLSLAYLTFVLRVTRLFWGDFLQRLEKQMPIRQLDKHINGPQKQSLVFTESLNLLRDCRIGVEGNYWIRKILKAPSSANVDQIRMTVFSE